MGDRAGGDALDRLTPREREVLDLLRRGLSDSEIGGRLGISRAGASYHVSEIIGKLGVRNRHEAAAWPERPPWWTTGLAPLGLQWRRAVAGLPIPASPVALALSVALFALVLAGAAFMAFLLIRTNGDATTEPTEIVVPGSAIDALESYAFSTRVEVSSSEGDLDLIYDGVAQDLFAVEGTFTGSGDLFERFGLPAQADIVQFDGQSWLREPGGAWEEPDFMLPPGDPGEPRRTAGFPLLVGLGTPWLYLEMFGFEHLRLPAEGDADTINGVDAGRVRLDKAGISDLLLQVTAVRVEDGEMAVSDEDIADIQNNAREALPDDFVVEAWIAEVHGYPVRLVFTFTVSDSEEGLLVGVFPPLSKVRLQIDITDPDVDAVIQPPVPIPTEPPGEEARIMEIVAADPRVAEIAGGRRHSIAVGGFELRTSEGEVLVGSAYVTFDEPFTYEGDWPAIIYDETETTDPPFREVVAHYRAEGIERLRVLVYLPEERVVEIAPEGAVISNRAPPAAE